MPRQARKKSETGIYHIMMRGINGELIFADEEDNRKFLFILGDCKKLCGFELYAYCLMANHFHLLIKPDREDLPKIFKRVCVRYFYWFNQKYGRQGHLFQDRYKSEPVDDEAYFLTALRYIHRNPVKAGIVSEPGSYAFSSYGEYINPERARLADTAFLYGIISRDEFIKYTEAPADDDCLDDSPVRIGDIEARKIIASAARLSGTPDYIPKLKSEGLSVRQISRLTGIPKKAVETGGRFFCLRDIK